MKTTLTLLALAALATSAHAAVFSGNGASGFGGPVGAGNVTVTDSASSLTFTFNRGSNGFNDALVVYLDTQAGGFTDTSTFSDNGDGGRTAASGYNGGNPSRSLVTFASGFTADYAMVIENGFIGVFQLVSGGNNSLAYQFGAGQSGNNLDASYSITLSAAQMAQIGLTAGSGQTFDLVGSYTSTSAYRSNETIGASVPSGNPGFNDPQVFIGSDAYTLVTVPEPATLSLLGFAGAGVLLRRRR